MTVPAAAVHLSRKYLKDAGYQVGGTTGALDTRDRQALSAEIERRRDELDPDYRDKILTGSSNRQLVAHIQLLARDKGAEPGKIDGLWGTRTDFAFSQLQHFDQYGQLPAPWRDPTAVVSPASQWPIQERAKLIAFYGQPGSHLTTIDIPYVLRIDWEPAVSTQRITCHDKVAASVQRVLHQVVSHYGEERIRELRLDRYGGCYNNRPMRGGTALSMHAWGIALDFDPSRNKLEWGRDRAAFSRPEYDAWWRAWEEEGWTSLGRRRNFDWMHVQAATLP
ncbi:MAG: M15 family metallopeptidase [Chromatiaceae bacterium]|nr:M15 family metallopeptidase [Candidatus Thioaporhodococcus sediminis]